MGEPGKTLYQETMPSEHEFKEMIRAIMMTVSADGSTWFSVMSNKQLQLLTRFIFGAIVQT